jgi:hypothetical protein
MTPSVTNPIPVYTRITLPPIFYIHLLVDNQDIVKKCKNIFVFQTDPHYFYYGGKTFNHCLEMVDPTKKHSRSLNKFIGGPELYSKQRIVVVPVDKDRNTGYQVYDYRIENFHLNVPCKSHKSHKSVKPIVSEKTVTVEPTVSVKTVSTRNMAENLINRLREESLLIDELHTYTDTDEFVKLNFKL